MTVIAEKARPSVRELLARELIEDVELILFTRGRGSALASVQSASVTSEETRELLGELAALSDRLHLTTYDIGADPGTATRYNVSEAPTVLIRRLDAKSRGPGTADATTPGHALDLLGHAAKQPGSSVEPGTNVRFLGLPGGYEFSTLVADVVDISKGRTDFSPETRAAVRAIDTPVHVQVFVTPSCPYCPPVARMAHQLAMENPLIVADVIEANELPELSDRYRVRSVPKTIINDRIEFVGSLPEAKVLEAVQQAVKVVKQHG
jgi:thiol-disulfide isomerase/thioredoxin